jgi:hypothetical protein
MRKLILFPLLLAACSSSPSSKLDTTTVSPAEAGGVRSLARVRGFTNNGQPPQGTQISMIALSDDYLFMAVRWDGVYRLPKYGGPAEVVDSVPGADYLEVAANRSRVFWDHSTYDDHDHADTRLQARSATGGSPSTLVEGNFGLYETNVSQPFQADEQNLYYISGNRVGNMDTLQLFAVPVGGGAATPLRTTPFPGTGEAYFAVDGEVYFSNGNEIDKIAANSTTPQKIADIPGPAQGLRYVIRAADADNVYAASDHVLYAVPRAGGAPTAVLTTTGNDYIGWQLTIDAQNIYYVGMDASGSAVFSVPRTGGTPTKIAGGDSQFSGGIDQMLQDEKNLFLLHGYGEVLMVPKTPADPAVK